VWFIKITLCRRFDKKLSMTQCCIVICVKHYNIVRTISLIVCIHNFTYTSKRILPLRKFKLATVTYDYMSTNTRHASVKPTRHPHPRVDVFVECLFFTVAVNRHSSPITTFQLRGGNVTPTKCYFSLILDGRSSSLGDDSTNRSVNEIA